MGHKSIAALFTIDAHVQIAAAFTIVNFGRLAVTFSRNPWRLKEADHGRAIDFVNIQKII
ncbi:hypothetical protein D3C87_2158990 [compost metagenome]